MSESQRGGELPGKDDQFSFRKVALMQMQHVEINDLEPMVVDLTINHDEPVFSERKRRGRLGLRGRGIDSGWIWPAEKSRNAFVTAVLLASVGTGTCQHSGLRIIGDDQVASVLAS